MGSCPPIDCFPWPLDWGPWDTKPGFPWPQVCSTPSPDPPLPEPSPDLTVDPSPQPTLAPPSPTPEVTVTPTPPPSKKPHTVKHVVAPAPAKTKTVTVLTKPEPTPTPTVVFSPAVAQPAVPSIDAGPVGVDPGAFVVVILLAVLIPTIAASLVSFTDRRNR